MAVSIAPATIFDRAMTDRIPCNVFQTDDLPPSEQFGAWRDSIAPMFDIYRAEVPPTGFSASFTSFLVGPMVMGRTSFGPHHFGRDSDRIQRDGLNHFHLILHVGGGYLIRLENSDLMILPNDSTLLDFSRPFQFLCDCPAELLVIAIPRDLIKQTISVYDSHGAHLKGDSPLGQVLSANLHTLHRWLPHMTMTETSAVATATAAMIAACFFPNIVGASSRPDGQRSNVFERIKSHIDRNLGSQMLTAEHLGEKFGVSRATLYRHFKSYGGLNAYIRDQRLSRSMTALMTPESRQRRISEIAHDWGFEDESTFSHVFRKEFGISPNQIRRFLANGKTDPDLPVDRAYQEWLQRLKRK